MSLDAPSTLTFAKKTHIANTRYELAGEKGAGLYRLARIPSMAKLSLTDIYPSPTSRTLSLTSWVCICGSLVPGHNCRSRLLKISKRADLLAKTAADKACWAHIGHGGREILIGAEIFAGGA